MAKNTKQNKKDKYKKIDSVDTNFKGEMGKVIKVLIAVLVFFGLFYLLTIYLLNKSSITDIKENVPEEATIQYQEILAGSSFNVRKDEYVVLFYDMSDASLRSDYTSLVTTYEEKENHLPIYTVNMGNSFNKPFANENVNTSPANVDELSIHGPTLIHFKVGSVIDYIQGYDEIKSFLE